MRSELKGNNLVPPAIAYSSHDTLQIIKATTDSKVDMNSTEDQSTFHPRMVSLVCPTARANRCYRAVWKEGGDQ